MRRVDRGKNSLVRDYILWMTQDVAQPLQQQDAEEQQQEPIVEPQDLEEQWVFPELQAEPTTEELQGSAENTVEAEIAEATMPEQASVLASESELSAAGYCVGEDIEKEVQEAMEALEQKAMGLSSGDVIWPF